MEEQHTNHESDSGGESTKCTSCGATLPADVAVCTVCGLIQDHAEEQAEGCDHAWHYTKRDPFLRVRCHRECVKCGQRQRLARVTRHHNKADEHEWENIEESCDHDWEHSDEEHLGKPKSRRCRECGRYETYVPGDDSYSHFRPLDRDLGSCDHDWEYQEQTDEGWHKHRTCRKCSKFEMRTSRDAEWSSLFISKEDDVEIVGSGRFKSNPPGHIPESVLEDARQAMGQAAEQMQRAVEKIKNAAPPKVPPFGGNESASRPYDLGDWRETPVQVFLAQALLKHVWGIYSGALDGNWSERTRGSFIKWANMHHDLHDQIGQPTPEKTARIWPIFLLCSGKEIPESAEMTECPDCDGQGSRPETIPGGEAELRYCTTCAGTGKVPEGSWAAGKRPEDCAGDGDE